MDCNFQQRHLRAAFAKRSQYRVLDSAEGQNVGLRVEEYEAIPWESVMGPPFCEYPNRLAVAVGG